MRKSCQFLHITNILFTFLSSWFDNRNLVGTYIIFQNCFYVALLLSYIQGLYRFLNKKFKYFTFPIFQGLHQCKKSALSLCICQVFQNVSSFRSRLLGSCQFYPKGLSVFAPFSLEFNLNYRLTLKFKDFSAPAAIFKDFEFLL